MGKGGLGQNAQSVLVGGGVVAEQQIWTELAFRRCDFLRCLKTDPLLELRPSLIISAWRFHGLKPNRLSLPDL